MRIAVACDHAGFHLKQIVIDTILEEGHTPIDLGTYDARPVDYPDYAEKLGRAILQREAERGVLLCGSGVGASIAANKIKGIYAGLCHDTYSAHQGVEHDNMNVLCLGERIIGPELARECVKSFLEANFLSDEERHVRRVGKIRKIEQENCSALTGGKGGSG
jgi:RpiB/LacA/LacB family sugar-phosphate isomerase